jgi:hypothetical protein
MGRFAVLQPLWFVAQETVSAMVCSQAMRGFPTNTTARRIAGRYLVVPFGLAPVVGGLCDGRVRAGRSLGDSLMHGADVLVKDWLSLRYWSAV